MDSVYTAQGATRSDLDSERRCSLHFAASWHTGLSTHNRYCADLALHRRAWVYYYRHFLCDHAFRHRAVAAYCAHFASRFIAGMEHVGALCDVSPTGGTEWVLWL